MRKGEWKDDRCDKELGVSSSSGNEQSILPEVVWLVFVGNNCNHDGISLRKDSADTMGIVLSNIVADGIVDRSPEDYQKQNSK
jgi:hypothetical protein